MIECVPIQRIEMRLGRFVHCKSFTFRIHKATFILNWWGQFAFETSANPQSSKSYSVKSNWRCSRTIWFFIGSKSNSLCRFRQDMRSPCKLGTCGMVQLIGNHTTWEILVWEDSARLGRTVLGQTTALLAIHKRRGRQIENAASLKSIVQILLTEVETESRMSQVSISSTFELDCHVRITC